MKTQVQIDLALIEKAIAKTGATDATAAVELALRDLVQAPRRLDLTELAGRIEFHDDYDYKALRQLRRDAG